MKTTDDRIQFIVSLANMDPADELRRGDLINLREDLESYLKMPPGDSASQLATFVVKKDELKLLRKYSREDFQELQRLVLFALLQSPIPGLQMIRRFGEAKVRFVLVGGANPRMEIEGSVRGVFVLILLLLLQRFSIIRCPECGEVFRPKTKRNKYCSRRCSNLASVKRWSRNPANKKKIQKARKDRSRKTHP